MTIIQGLLEVFLPFSVLMVAVSGILLMLSPDRGRELLTNTVIGLAIFLLGYVIFRSAATPMAPAPPSAHILTFIGLCIYAAAGLGLLAAGFVYTLNPSAAKQLLRQALPTVVGVFLLIGLLAAIATRNQFAGLILLSVLTIVAYLVRERRLRAIRSHRAHTTHRTERTPVFPREQQQ